MSDSVKPSKGVIPAEDTLVREMESLSVRDPPAAPLGGASTLPVTSTRSASTTAPTEDIPANPVKEKADPFPNGPLIDSKLKWARMTCEICYKKSPENFSFRSYYCQQHGSAISNDWRLDCVAEFEVNRVAIPCTRASYKVLHPNDNELTFQCDYHCRNGKSRIFKTRFRAQSEDFMLQAGDNENLLISGKDFDRMAFDYSYSSEIKENIRRAIHSFQSCLNFDSAVEEKKIGILQGLNAKLKCDVDELRKIHDHYRDHLAQGHVYMVLYRNKGFTESKKLSIKIGYSGDVVKRLSGYKCGTMHESPLAVIPSKTSEAEDCVLITALEKLYGAYLLEQIFHAIFAQLQQDRRCNCKKDGGNVTHAEVFDFEPVHGIENEWKAARSRVEDMRVQMYDWVDIIKKAKGALMRACEVYGPIRDNIEEKLVQAGERLYYN
ncbi:hypothetical protein EC991_009792 [Linnemannia zychae]|nr:hypothetical protein EC991_009792 [Linnemannia zychae]